MITIKYLIDFELLIIKIDQLNKTNKIKINKNKTIK